MFEATELSGTSSSSLSVGPGSLVEDPTVLGAFAGVLEEFKQGSEDGDLFGMVKSFREISTGELLKLAEADIMKHEEDEEKLVVENWVLETKFWNLVEVLVGFRSSDEYNDTSEVEIDEFTSQVVIKQNILSNSTTLRELDLLSYWLIHNSNLDDNQQELDRDTLPSTKWLNTKIDLLSNQSKPDLVSSLDSDATLRNNRPNKRPCKINAKDSLNDERFFQAVFELLLQEKHDEVLELCKFTNNWTLSAILAGTHDYIDPEIDNLDGLEDEDESMGLNKPTGIKNKFLWRRTVFLLSKNPNLGKYERAIYSYLAGDYTCADLTESWESQLLVLTNNILQHDLELQAINYLDPSLNEILKLAKPEKRFENIGMVLNHLAQSSNEKIKRQSLHSIRVLMGAIITNNVDHLISNSIGLLDELILSNDRFRNNSTLTLKNTNSLIKESYLLRILIHFIITMKFLNDNIIADENLIKLIKLYLTRLSLYKLYHLMPIYISYIPSESEIIENYSFFLSSIIIDQEDRLVQLKSMRSLELPLENILKQTVERIFNDTKAYYEQKTSVDLGNEPVTKLDTKLINSISWFVDSGMVFNTVALVNSLARRFLLSGKVHSLMRLFESLDMLKIVNDFKIEKEIGDEYHISELKSNVNIDEIGHYQMMINTFVLIDEFEQNIDELEQQRLLHKIIQSIYPLITLGVAPLVHEFSTDDDFKFYHSLETLYLPYLVLKVLKFMESFQSKELSREFKKLVSLISSEQHKIYQIFTETGQLKQVLDTIVTISINQFDHLEKGVYE